MDLTLQLAAVELAWTLPDDATPTPAQTEILAAFTGWGAFAPAFAATPTDAWLRVADRLDAALPAEAFTIASEQVDTSFFTPASITAAVYRLLADTGFTGGNILEPGCGAGAFMSAAPAGWDVQFTGVELDPTSARIATLLNPNATILTGKLESTVVREDHFDAAIGNVPFSSVRVFDKEGRGGSLHNYFIRRAVDAIRPGGYVILVTSRHTIDATTGLAAALDDMDGAAFIGAVRLPAGAFADTGTDAVTDIVVLRKNDSTHTQAAWAFPADTERTPAGHEWNGRPRYTTTDNRLPITEPVRAGLTIHDAPKVSAYWARHPEHVAARMLATGFERAPITVHTPTPDVSITAAVSALASVLPPLTPLTHKFDLSDVTLTDADGRKEGSFHVIDGALHRVTSGHLAPVRAHQELRALVGLRDLAVHLLDAESNMHTPDAQIAPLRTETLDAYRAYVAKFGHLNRGTLVEGKPDEDTGLPALSWRRPAMGGFRRDPDAALVMALEVFDQDTGEAGPAPILIRRVNRLPEPIERVDTAAEALAVSLGETGRVDLARIGGLLGLAGPAAAVEHAVTDALGELVYDDRGQWVPASEFLSGNVRAKLEAARAAGNARNIAALEAVLPAALGPLDITMTLGSPFVTTSDVEDFLREEMGVRWPRVNRVDGMGVWEVDEASSDAAAQLRWATTDTTPASLVECALNARMPEVTDRVWNSERHTWVRVRNLPATAAANEKLELIRDRFSMWVWEDEGRAARICAAYNRDLNSHVTRTYSGAGLTFPWLSAEVTPWAHQRAAVERMASTPRALLAHPVGAGKTLEMVMGARTLRQFGLANKPLIVVPNHLLDQIAREAQQAYPTGRFLVATKEDLARDARRLFAARCATGDWDAVIITHSAFTSIPVHPNTEKAWLDEQKFELKWRLQDATGGRKDKGPKAIARAIRALESRMGQLRSGVGDTDAIWFEQLGVDYLLVDEAHLFRRLDTGSSNRENALTGGSSKRATDLLVKIETLAERRPAGAPIVALFTGTPWSNTLAETYVWQRYLQPDTLEAVGMLAFDSWVSAFVRYETSIEVAPDGSGFRMQRRPVEMANAPEVRTMLAQVADLIDPASLGLNRPDYTVNTEVVDPTPEQREYVRDLAVRADGIRNKTAAKRTKLDGGETDDSMLLVCTDGRKVALDPRLVGLDEQSAKIERLADLAADAYRQNRDRAFGSHPTPGAFQLAFLDLGTPKPGESSTYGRVRRAVADRGVPAHMIRFVHEATTDKGRAALFAACRDGEVALLVGSTSKVGMGTNVQTRLTHLWHVDAPWLPSDVIQRDGRAIRPGNLSGHVTITRLVTEGTFDAYTWQALERKSRSFDALYATSTTARRIEDVSAATLSYGQVKALASGNPLLLEQAQAQAAVKKLQLMRSVHLQSVRKAEQTARTLTADAAAGRRTAALCREAAEASSKATAEPGAGALTRTIERWIAPGKRETWGGISSSTTTVNWRGVTLRPRHQDGRLASVSIQYRYVTISEVPVFAQQVRRGAQSLAEVIAAKTDELLDGLTDSADRADARADRADAEAEASRNAASAAVFEGEADLTAALSRLAEVEARIADAAITAARTPATTVA